MRHKDGPVRILQYPTRRSPEDEFPKSPMTVTTHDDEISVPRRRMREQHMIDRVFRMRNLLDGHFDAMTSEMLCQLGGRSSGLDFRSLGYCDHEDLFGHFQKRQAWSLAPP